MNKNVIIVLVGGFVVAVLVAVLVQASLSGKKTNNVVTKEAPTVQILVADHSLPIGHTLGEDDMKWRKWPQDAVFEGAIVRKGDQKPEEAIDGSLLRDIAEGEPIMESALIGDGRGNFLASSLGPGMRAVTINVNPASAVAGFVNGGDYVDVILTYKVKIKYDGEDRPDIDDMVELAVDSKAAETILQNIHVLAVDQDLRRNDEKKRVGKTVTLEVNAHDAEVLILAQEMGDLSLTLRKTGDEAMIAKREGTLTDEKIISVTDEVFEEIRRMENSSGYNGSFVRIYSGDRVENIPLGK
jgi:pilus assembly protein CpaB